MSWFHEIFAELYRFSLLHKFHGNAFVDRFLWEFCNSRFFFFVFLLRFCGHAWGETIITPWLFWRVSSILPRTIIVGKIVWSILSIFFDYENFSLYHRQLGTSKTSFRQTGTKMFELMVEASVSSNFRLALTFFVKMAEFVILSSCQKVSITLLL